jgi:hypothetical protein
MKLVMVSGQQGQSSEPESEPPAAIQPPETFDFANYLDSMANDQQDQRSFQSAAIQPQPLETFDLNKF